MSNLSYLLIYTIFISTDTFVQNFGIALISAQCANVANRNSLFNTNLTTRMHRISGEKMISENLKKGQDIRVSLFLSRPDMLTIKLSKCSLDQLNYQLFFNETVNLTKHLPKNSSVLNVPCAPVGQYDLVLTTNINCNIHINVTLPNPSKIVRINKFIQMSRIQYQKRIASGRLLLTWDKSKFDIHAMNYCVAVNMQRNLNNLCEAVDLIIGQTPKLFCSQLKGINNFFIRTADKIMNVDPRRGTALACMGKKNKQLLQGLKSNHKYFVDIFGVRPEIDKLTFKLASTQIYYNRTKPLKLNDGYIETGKITGIEKKSLFVFKVPRIQSSITSELKFLIMPCGTAMTAKVFNRKTLLITMDIFEPAVIRINETTPGERYLLRITPMNSNDEIQRFNFKVAATIKEAFPTLPAGMEVEEIKSLSTCTTSTVTWQPSLDHRNIKYCVAVTKLKNKDFSEPFSSATACDFEKMNTKPHLSYRKCFRTSQNEAKSQQRFEITDLKPGSKYLIQIIMRFGKNSIPYRPLNLSKGRFCHRETVNFEENKLPKIFSTNLNFNKKIPITKYEDNNILVP